MVYLLLVHVFDYFTRVNVCHFSLPLGVRGWMRLAIVALPERLYEGLDGGGLEFSNQ